MYKIDSLIIILTLSMSTYGMDNDNSFDLLPPEIIADIFTSMDLASTGSPLSFVRSVGQLSAVNRQFRDLLYNKSFLACLLKTLDTQQKKDLFFTLSTLDNRFKTKRYHSLMAAFTLITDEEGKSPLHWAAKGCKEKAVHEFINHIHPQDFELKINARDKDGYAPLHYALNGFDSTIPLALIEKGAEINNANNIHKETPLHRASYFGNSFILKKLLEHEATINAQNDQGQTALHILLTLAYTCGVYRGVSAARCLFEFSRHNTERFIRTHNI